MQHTEVPAAIPTHPPRSCPATPATPTPSNGAYLDFQPAPVASKPQYAVRVLSIWTKNSIEFGGALPSMDHEPCWSYFSGVNRLICDLPSPNVSAQTALLQPGMRDCWPPILMVACTYIVE